MIINKQIKIKLILIFFCVCLVLIGVVYKLVFQEEEVSPNMIQVNELIEENAEANNEEKSTLPQEEETIFIDVKGAVLKEGVYEVKPGTRVKDVIEMAGGFTSEAELKQVNLALRVEDEMILYVPKIGEVEATVGLSTNQEDNKISINKASSEELQKLTGIGPSKAAAIISYREEFGPFETIEDLLQVTGIGEKSLEKIKDELTLN